MAGKDVSGTSRLQVPWRNPWVGIPAAVAALIGLWALWRALGSIWIPVGVIAFGVVATLPFLARALVLALCAVVVAILALIGFNVVLGLILGDERLEIRLGLILAVIVFAAASYVFLRGATLRMLPERWRSSRRLKWLEVATPTPGLDKLPAAILAAILAIGVIIGLPRVLSSAGDVGEEAPDALPVEARPGADVDVLIVAERRYPVAVATRRDPARGGFVPAYADAVDLDVSYAVGRAQESGVLWTRTGITEPAEARAFMASAPAAEDLVPERRDGAEGAIVLVVDGTPPVVQDPETLDDVAATDGDAERWAAIARGLRSGAWNETPVYALLQSEDEARLAEWTATFEELGGVISVQRFGSQTVTDAGVRLAVGSSTAEEDFWLTMRHRPILLFDREEPVPRPLDIDQLFDDERVRQCADLDSEGTCGSEPPIDTAALRTPGRHLVISPPKGLRDLAIDEQEAWEAGRTTLESAPVTPVALAATDPGAPPPGTPPAPAAPAAGVPLGAGSRIYVNPVLVEQDERRLLHLDYWWYLPDNPTRSGKGAFCGAGMVILGITCFDHESDWEGVTLVLERKGEAWEKLAVYYAQHDSVVRYEWEDLRDHWDGGGGLTDDLQERLPDHAERPLVFVADGTHAGYAHRCSGGDCRQVASQREEGDHDGRLVWVGDDTAACLRVACLTALPTAAGGGPATWNAFEGPWGRRHCEWTYYCDSGTPPPAPGQQERYKHPQRYDGRADVSDGTYDEGE